MNMKKIIIAISALVIAGVSCSKVNELDDRVGKLEQRMDAVENAITQINSNIGGLQLIVEALSQKDFIREIKDIKDSNNKVIGYEIVFDKKGSVKIYHGTDGQQGPQGPQGPEGPVGATPQIGISKDTDGVYYWTLNGNWLLASDGKKVVAVGKDGSNGQDGTPGTPGAPGTPGQDGVTPRLKIENGSWHVWYNETDGWVQLGVATSVTTDSFFTSVTKEGNDLVLNLTDGSVYRIPIGSQLSIVYDVADTVVVQPGETRTVHYVITSSVGSADIEVLSSADIKAKIANQQGLEGDIVIVCGEEITEYSKVVVLVNDGNRIITDRFVFETEGMTITDNSQKTFAAAAGDLEIEFLTNTDFTVEIPAEAQSWISLVSTRAMSIHGITLRIAENTGMKRSATVSVKSKISDLHIDYTISQEGLMGSVKFTYTGASYSGTFPSFTGNTQGAVIDWGDAVSTAWGTFTHSYTDGKTSHTITVGMLNMTEVSLASLKNISALDVSGM